MRRLLVALLLLVSPAAYAQINITMPPGVGGGAGTSVSHVPTNAVLIASATTTYPNGVWRDDFSAGLGATPQWYLPSGVACSLAAGAGDNGSQVASSDGKCWLAVFPANGADIREWGVLFDGNTTTSATANTTTMQKALNWFAQGNTLLLPSAPIAYHAAALAVTLASNTVAASITGPGRDQAILGYTGSGTGLTITFANSTTARNSVHLSNWTYCNNQAGVASGIALTQNANIGTGSLPFNDFNLTMRGCDGWAAADYWATALTVTGVFGIDFKGLNIQGPSAPGTLGTGVSLNNGASSITAQYNFPGVTMTDLLVGIAAGANIQGVTITGGSNFVTVGTAFKGTSGVGTDQITIADSQFNCVNICIWAPWASVMIHDNYFIGSVNGVPMIYLPSNNEATILGNTFRNGGGFTNLGVLRIDTAPATAGDGVTVVGNTALAFGNSLIMPNAVALPINARANVWGGAAPSLAAGATTNLDQALPFANVLAPASAIQQTQVFTDSNTVVWGANIAAGGVSKVLGANNGTNWTVTAK